MYFSFRALFPYIYICMSILKLSFHILRSLLKSLGTMPRRTAMVPPSILAHPLCLCNTCLFTYTLLFCVLSHTQVSLVSSTRPLCLCITYLFTSTHVYSHPHISLVSLTRPLCLRNTCLFTSTHVYSHPRISFVSLTRPLCLCITSPLTHPLCPCITCLFTCTHLFCIFAWM
jgi:hypothetical protein